MRSAAAETLFDFYNLTGEVHAALTKRAEAVLPHGLTMPQFELLDHVNLADKPVTPIELANRFHLTKGAITNLLKQLQNKSFVKLDLNPSDKRSKFILVSEEGTKAHRECLAALYEMTTLILKGFSSDELEICFPTFNKLKHWLEEN